MNLTKLKQAEQQFFTRYPLGFSDPDMLLIGKKHKMDSMIASARENFAPKQFKDVFTVADAMSKVVSRSSMVSLFEKPKFRDLVAGLDNKRRQQLTAGLHKFLHGDQQAGFEQMLELLGEAGLAKWSLLTIIPNYYAPNDEVFIKPTTAKGVIAWFELENLQYSPRPSWEFYAGYREAILAMRTKVDRSLAPNNAAFCGFLMMSMGG